MLHATIIYDQYIRGLSSSAISSAVYFKSRYSSRCSNVLHKRATRELQQTKMECLGYLLHSFELTEYHKTTKSMVSEVDA